jgi:two-component system sensor histidine kinase BaeS
MKIGIAHRLFLVILAAASLAVVCIFLIIQWNFDRGFIQYLKGLDQGRRQQLALRLEQAYAGHENWDFLRVDPIPWIMRLMAESSDNDIAPERFKKIDQGGDVPSFPPPPLIVLNEERKPVFGSHIDTENINFTAIVHGGKTVGYVGLLSPKHFLGPPQFEFLKRQKSTLVMAASGMVLVVVIFSLPLANRLVRPIKAVAAATHDLASGKYATRVTVSSSDELGQLARNFNALALTLEKNEKARRQWVADISHELRTPLSVLRGEIEALMEGIRNTTPESIRSLHAEVMRLHRLVDDLYQLALSDLGTLAYHKEELNLPALLRDSIESHRAEFIRKGITLTFDASQESGLTVFADSERLYQLFGNLLDNSLKYTDAEGELAVRLACIDNQAVVEFRDSAPAVFESDLGRLFDRLYRVEGSRNRASGGAGLGLAICKNIVEAHEGTITAHPSPLGGVIIVVAIPVAGRCA